MDIAVIALGSRGDVQPYVALGKGLKQAGHTVRLITHENYQGLAESSDLPFFGVRGDVQAFAQSDEMRELSETGNFLKLTAKMANAGKEAAALWAEDSLAACQGAELLLAGFGGMFVGLALSQKLGIPLIQAHVFPFTPTGDFASVLLPQGIAKLGGFFNRISHHLTRQLMWQGVRGGDNVTRQKLGLRSAPFFGPYRAKELTRFPVLYGMSQHVIPQPTDWKYAHITGHWYLDSPTNWSPPSSLTHFLAGGPKPIYIGLGSMGNRNPEQTKQTVLDAIDRSGQRTVLLSGWSGFSQDDVPDTVYLADSLPHSWLFPQMSAVIHHGGAGTTAAGLRSGVPSILIPFFGDQPFWGQRVFEFGVGPRPILRNQLTAEVLVNAIKQAVTDSKMQERAAELGTKIQNENGVTRAVELIEHFQVNVDI